MMDEKFAMVPFESMMAQTVVELRACNDISVRFGLVLSDAQMLALAQKRFEALREMGRIELGAGVLGKLVYAFCDSPYIDQSSYEDTLHTLQEIFYYFKNESMDAMGDDDLIRIMRLRFDNECQGSLAYLMETALEDICRDIRYGYGVCGKDR